MTVLPRLAVPALALGLLGLTASPAAADYSPAPTLPQRPPAPAVQYGGNVLPAPIDETTAKDWVSTTRAALDWAQPLLDFLVVDAIASESVAK